MWSAPCCGCGRPARRRGVRPAGAGKAAWDVAAEIRPARGRGQTAGADEQRGRAQCGACLSSGLEGLSEEVASKPRAEGNAVSVPR